MRATQDSPPVDTIKQIEACPLICFIVRMGMDDIGFQDSCDGSFIVIVPMFRAIEADL